MNRPVNLNLMSVSFPPMAIVSILHRISGVLLFVLIPVFFYVLAQSLVSSSAFLAVQASLQTLPYKAMTWLLLSSFVFHLIAGLRHLLMDFGIGEGLVAGRYTAILVLIFSFLMAAFLGYWLW